MTQPQNSTFCRLLRRSSSGQIAQPASRPDTARSGVALVSVLALSVMVLTLVPIMLRLNTENIDNARQSQTGAIVAAQSRSMLMLANEQLKLYGGLPLGWQRGDTAATADIEAISSCSRTLGRLRDPATNPGGDRWDAPDARVSIVTSTDARKPIAGDRLIAGIRYDDTTSLPYEVYVVMGCVITDLPYSRLAVSRAVFALSGGELFLVEIEAITS